MTAWARVGAKVVCVDDSPHNGSWYSVLPSNGVVYTICRVQWWEWPAKSGIGVWLREIRRPYSEGIEHPWGLDRFRPLITKTQEQDIAIFKSLLTDIPINETAN